MKAYFFTSKCLVIFNYFFFLYLLFFSPKIKLCINIKYINNTYILLLHITFDVNIISRISSVINRTIHDLIIY